MPATLDLDHRGPIMYESVVKKDTNIIGQVAHRAAAAELSQTLLGQQADD